MVVVCCKNDYILPLNREDIIRKRKRYAHSGKIKYAHDFLVPMGTRIFAAAGGKVVWLRDNSRVGGTDKKKYWYKGNRIVIRHRNGEHTAYEHLKYKGAVVKVGQQVKRGQLIGYSGNTGWSRIGPHLHFEVFNSPDSDECEGEILQVRFKKRFISSSQR